jgi:taurine dioxygenase
MGAKISGVDLSKLTDDAFADIEDALYRHKMIYFRDQPVSHGDQEALTSRFGEFGADAYTTGLPEHPNVQPVIKEADARVRIIFGDGWHTDSPFLSRPPAISMLHGVDIPPYGGDTIWANTELAYAYLSDGMKAMLAPLRIHMSAVDVLTTLEEIGREPQEPGSDSVMTGSFGKITGKSSPDDDAAQRERQSMIDGCYHPLVRTHPATGKKALYVDQTYSQGLEGMTGEESKPLLDYLLTHVTQPSFTCRLRWKRFTLVIWDNRSCIHHAFNDYDGYRREMYRTTVLGESPA